MMLFFIISVGLSLLFKGLSIWQLTNKKLEERQRKIRYFTLNLGFYFFVSIAFFLIFTNQVF